jgi:hypothetical protein
MNGGGNRGKLPAAPKTIRYGKVGRLINNLLYIDGITVNYRKRVEELNTDPLFSVTLMNDSLFERSKT